MAETGNYAATRRVGRRAVPEVAGSGGAKVSESAHAVSILNEA